MKLAMCISQAIEKNQRDLSLDINSKFLYPLHIQEAIIKKG